MSDREPPRVAGTHQIRQLLGVSRSRAAQIVNTKGFPEPFARLGKARLWLTEDIEAWARSKDRQLHDLPVDEA